jgi:hypothetical protein
VRDAVEAALSDVILLGTEEQVRLAARAANEMVAGRSVEIAELVVSLRTFIREVLDLDAVPPEVTIPRQGPLRAGGARAAASGRWRRPRRRGRGAAGGGGGCGGRRPSASAWRRRARIAATSSTPTKDSLVGAPLAAYSGSRPSPYIVSSTGPGAPSAPNQRL